MLESLDLDRKLSRAEYQKVYPGLQEQLRGLQYRLREAEIPTVVVFEGWDAAGKGTMIQQLTEGLDPRVFQAYPGSPPSELEQRYHWLWRYQIRLPEDGYIVLFDHSWYGRVLVERVEHFVKKKVWKPAFDQINQFERWLTDDGQILVKFFFHITRDEQARRLKAMEANPLERWKVQKEDWRRNDRYDKWVKAIEEMVGFTDTRYAPWTLVEATDARWTRVQVLGTLVRRMADALARREKTPGAVSRTRLAKAAGKDERRRQAAESLSRAKETAREAGLPIEGTDEAGEGGK